jgi:hypothetical protein
MKTVNELLQNDEIFIDNAEIMAGEFTTHCLYCKEIFNFLDASIDEKSLESGNSNSTLVFCPNCNGGHETKGFI